MLLIQSRSSARRSAEGQRDCNPDERGVRVQQGVRPYIWAAPRVGGDVANPIAQKRKCHDGIYSHRDCDLEVRGEERVEDELH